LQTGLKIVVALQHDCWVSVLAKEAMLYSAEAALTVSMTVSSTVPWNLLKKMLVQSARPWSLSLQVCIVLTSTETKAVLQWWTLCLPMGSVAAFPEVCF